MRLTLSIFGVAILAIAGFYFLKQVPIEKPAPKVTVASSPQITIKTPQCPEGFVQVPGNAKYQTTDFCVMKYDAKCADINNPSQGLQPALGDPASGEDKGHAYGVYKNNGKESACISANSKTIVSTASGFPITYIPESGHGNNNAENYCSQKGWHLITNNEWMTIARNVEQVADNWCNPDGTECGAEPGTKGKILANGHNDGLSELRAGGSSHDSAIVAGSDDQPCFGTTTDGSNKCGGKSSQKRMLILSNSNVLWDFAGNVWQWVDGTVFRKDEPKSKSYGKLDSGWLSSEFAPGALPSVITDNGGSPSLGYDSFRPSNPNWNSNNGVGRIFHYSSVTDKNMTVYGFIRGGQWNHGAVDGAFSMHLTPVPDKANINDIGFRCATSI